MRISLCRCACMNIDDALVDEPYSAQIVSYLHLSHCQLLLRMQSVFVAWACQPFCPETQASFVICWQLWSAQWTVIMQNKVPGRSRLLRGLTSLLGCCASRFSLGHLTTFRMTVEFAPLQTCCSLLVIFFHGIASKEAIKLFFRKFRSSHSFKIFRKKKKRKTSAMKCSNSS